MFQSQEHKCFPYIVYVEEEFLKNYSNRWHQLIVKLVIHTLKTKKLFLTNTYTCSFSYLRPVVNGRIWTGHHLVSEDRYLITKLHTKTLRHLETKISSISSEKIWFISGVTEGVRWVWSHYPWEKFSLFKGT